MRRKHPQASQCTPPVINSVAQAFKLATSAVLSAKVTSNPLSLPMKRTTVFVRAMLGCHACFRECAAPECLRQRNSTGHVSPIHAGFGLGGFKEKPVEWRWCNKCTIVIGIEF